jgi:D-3-phosphoglycerate dehydrogenase / 2-oxoglutarate reductase
VSWFLPIPMVNINQALKDELEHLVGEVVYNTTGKPLSSQQVSALLPGIDGYIAGLDQIDRHALQSADTLKIIARYGVGVDQVDLEAAREKGIIVSNTPGANSASVAELAVGMLLILARQIPAATSAIQRGEWPRLPGLDVRRKNGWNFGFRCDWQAFCQAPGQF